MESISARSIIDAVPRGGSNRKVDRHQRLTPAALAVAEQKVRSAYPPVIIAGVVRRNRSCADLIGRDSPLFWIRAFRTWRLVEICCLSSGIAAAAVVVFQVLDFYQVPQLQARSSPRFAIATLLVRSLHIGDNRVPRRKTR